MPKITSNLTGTKAFVPMEPDWMPGKCIEAKYDDSEAHPIIMFSWEIGQYEKEVNGHRLNYTGRKVNFDRCMVGGANDVGEPYSLNRLLMYIGALGVTWECGECGASNTLPPERDHSDYRCPSCKAIPSTVSYMSEDFVNKSCMLNVSKVQQRTKDPENPGKYVPLFDEDSRPVYQNNIKAAKAA